MLLCFGFYNLAADAGPGAFIEAESRNAVAYRAGCRSFGWECLGNYACTGQPTGSLPFGYVHVYVIFKDRCLVVCLCNGAEAPEQVGHPGWLGRFSVDGAAGAGEAEVCVHGSGDADSAHAGRSWVLTPVVTGGETVPPLA